MELDGLKLYRKDFLAVVSLGVFDIIFTVYGITFRGFGELSPLFRPFTSSTGMMLTGGFLYITVLEVFNLMLYGRARTVLASAAAGIHLSAIVGWIALFFVPALSFQNVPYLHLLMFAFTSSMFHGVFEQKGWNYTKQS